MPDTRPDNKSTPPPAEKPAGDGAPGQQPDEIEAGVEAVARVGQWVADQVASAPDDVKPEAFALCLAAALEDGASLADAPKLAAEAAAEMEDASADLDADDGEDGGNDGGKNDGGNDGSSAKARRADRESQERVPGGNSDGGQFAPAGGGGGGSPSAKEKAPDVESPEFTKPGAVFDKKSFGQKVAGFVKETIATPGKIAGAIREQGVVGAAKTAGQKMVAGVKGAAKGMEEGLVKSGVNRRIARGVAVAAAVIAVTPLSVGVVAAASGLAPAWVAAVPGALEAGAIYGAAAGAGKAIGKARAAIGKLRGKKGKGKAAAVPHVTQLDAIDQAILQATGSVAAMASGVLNGKYVYTRTEEGLLVPRTELMTFISPDERPDFGMGAVGVDETWLQAAAKTAAIMAAKRKLPRLLERHNSFILPADVIGRVLGMRYERPWLIGDALITNPAACGKAARGEYPSRSAEFLFEDRYVWGLSLICGQEGHFDEELPDFVLAEQADIDELRKLGSDPARPRARRAMVALPFSLQLTPAKEPDMADNPATTDAPGANPKPGDKPADKPADVGSLDERFGRYKQECDARFANIESAIKALQSGGVQAPAVPAIPALPGTPVAPVVPQPQALAADKAEIARLTAALAATEAERKAALASQAAAVAAQARAERALQVERDVADIRAAGSPLLVDDLRARLSACAGAEAYGLTVKHLKSLPTAPTDSLPPDPVKAGRVALEAEYASIVKAHAAQGKPAPFSFDEYARAAERSTATSGRS